MQPKLPIAVIGAGPVGLAAAAHLIQRGLEPVIFERGEHAATAVRQWGHVRVFTPWTYVIDSAARALLSEIDWTEPQPDALPTGDEIVDAYLAPLAAHPSIAARLHTNATVTDVTRDGASKIHSEGRETASFAVHWRDAAGIANRTLVSAVIDASGTWFDANPIGIGGLPVPGETDAADRIEYRIPDVLGRDRATYAGQRILLLGGGHSAANVALDLATLHGQHPDTRISWGIRRKSIESLLGGGADDELPARGQLGLAAKDAIDTGTLELLAPYAVDRIERIGDGIKVFGHRAGVPMELVVDRIVVTTGFRPNIDMLRELRVELDPMLEAPPKLAPLIDPNVHSCGSVPPHGVAELAHPEPGFFIVGMKSYGRAPTFLMLTGYEQVRSVAAELAGDHDAARRVELKLPETGVCGGFTAASCCEPEAETDLTSSQETEAEESVS
ncbi:FAD-dependent oxidoreductase [Kaustia mangrovi]|uniref:FAD-dependent oxidoreductase n=1 Tax=Kaustia mangrovi TaxID=2593653 RepID=A0A7S8C3N1_9HYPH|nr:FAD-dependent oxidoreductase [Kaustia mangrovi]QPC42770.1 FAD-dependent oxidoreductase [Kaustia mangrovi]